MKIGKFGLGLLFLANLGLTACGGGESSSKDASLEHLVSVWYYTEVIDGKEDIYYTVIKADGSIIDYDYQNDEFDQGDDCYYKYDEGYLISDLGNGEFSESLLEDSNYFSELKVKIDGNTATITIIDSSVESDIGISYSQVRTDLSESDLTPLCNELF